MASMERRVRGEERRWCDRFGVGVVEGECSKDSGGRCVLLLISKEG